MPYPVAAARGGLGQGGAVSLAPLYTSLVAYWSLDQVSGNRVDRIGANALTDNNTVLANNTGGPVYSVVADFENDNSETLTIADNAAVSMTDIDFWMATWVKLESKVNNRRIISKDDNSTNREYFLIYRFVSDGFRFGLSGNGTTFTSVDSTFGSPAIGTGYWLFAWHDSVANTINLQVNNGTIISAAHTTGGFNGTSAFALGGWPAFSGEYWDGLMGNAMIGKGYIPSVAERTWLYNSGSLRTLDEIKLYASQPAFTRYSATPVVALGLNTGDAGRILEPTVMKDGSTYKMWYSGMATNGGGLDQDWNIYYATSTDGVNWTGQGQVMDEAWEPDVIKVASTYYMAYVADHTYNVRFATSPDGINWTDKGEIIPLSASAWSKGPTPTPAPREPNLLYDSGTFYCYYGDQAAADDKYKIGVASCSGDPTVPANWTVQAIPVFAPTTTSPRWNQGGDTESPCVRYYAELPHPYLMTFIGYNNLETVTNKPWRVGMAYADSPTGPWTEFSHNPVMVQGRVGNFDDGIAGECNHFIDNGTLYLYYAGGRNNGANQVGLATISVTNLIALM